MRKSGKIVTVMFLITAACILLATPFVLAEQGGETSGGNVVQSGMTPSEIVTNGGWAMVILGVMSVVTVALIIYFATVLRASQIVPRPLYRELVEKVDAGMIDEAVQACEYHPCPLSSVAISAMDHYRNNPSMDPVLLKDLVQGEGERQADNLQGPTQYLLDIGVIAPMVGLLGTVLGMLEAFSGVALSSALAKPVMLAGGVSKALITTASGLVVAIPAMIAYSIFRRRATKLVSYLESASVDLLAALVKEKK